MTGRLRVNSPRVMHETIEGEVIVIDLTTGSYYSLRGTAAEIWEGIVNGVDERGIDEMLARRYETSREEITASVSRLLEELAAEGLIELSEAGGEAAPAPASAGPAQVPDTNGRAPFQAPVLEKHSDMQDLILLDPVHEVGPEGWPHAAEPGAGA